MHARNPSGPPRQLTPEELADRAQRIAGRQRRLQRQAKRIKFARDSGQPRGFLARHGDEIFVGFLGFLGLAITTIGCILLPPAISAAEGHGTHGVFVADQYLHGRGKYDGYWLGSFTASNHRLVVRNVDYIDPPSDIRAGSSLPALYPGGSEVFAPHGSSAWFEYLLLTVAGLALFSGWVWHSPVKSLRQRRRLRAQAAADPMGALLLAKRPLGLWHVRGTSCEAREGPNDLYAPDGPLVLQILNRPGVSGGSDVPRVSRSWVAGLWAHATGSAI